MAEPPKPRPTADELDELIELVRRDPASPAFVDLGEAYLALGRPREAIDVGLEGLRYSADNHEGRLMVARGHAALHQWKEAQAELLRIVKVDRTNRVGFTLLGEVLMRRADYERAVPVLQHAQNLDPGSPQVLNLLRLARGSLPLDAPAPIPTPIAPRRGDSPAPRAPARASAPPPAPPRAQAAPPRPPPRPPARPSPPAAEPIDDGPTTVGGGAGNRAVTAEETAVRGDPTMPSVPPAMMNPAWDSGSHDAHQDAPTDKRGGGQRMPLSPPPAAAPADARSARPRIIPNEKPVNAAAASLRQSAAVGETYLNDLLTGGLLDVPGVRVPDAEFDLRPDRRWGRSTTRAFIFLFVLLVFGVGGGGAWWYYSEQQKAEAVAKHRAKARELVTSGTWEGLNGSLNELASALKRDKDNERVFAQTAEAISLRAMLYGAPDDGADQGIKAAARGITAPEQDGFRDLVIARTALALAKLDGSEASIDGLVKARVALDAWTPAQPDRWGQWLKGRTLLVAGQRGAAMTAFQQAGEGASDGAAGLVLAQIDRANLLVDDGKFDDAMKLYDEVLSKVPDHPLAVLGKSLARAERGNDTSGAMDDLNVKLDKDLGERTDAYRQLALALAYYGLEDYVRMNEALGKATQLREPRFLSRYALARILQGNLSMAAVALNDVKWYGSGKPEADPLVTLVNGALQLAAGTPEAALETLGKLDGTRAQILRGQALLDMGKHKEALEELDAAQKAAPDSLEVKIWRELAVVLTSTGKARTDAAEELEKTSRRAKSKIGRHAHGVAMLLTGDLKEARRRLEQALENVTPEEPAPLSYRSRVALATIERTEGNLDAATTQLEKALEDNPGYLPARLELAKVMVAKGDGDAAGDMLAAVMAEKELVKWDVELLYAEALARKNRDGLKDKEKAQIIADATAALERAKAAGAPLEQVARVAVMIDEKLLEKLELPDPPGADDKPAKPSRRGRRR
jgi:tetratricopeptide (TPR) repeat protein